MKHHKVKPKTMTVYHGTSMRSAIRIKRRGFSPTLIGGARGRPARLNSFTDSRHIAGLYAKHPNISAVWGSSTRKDRRIGTRAVLRVSIPKSEAKRYLVKSYTESSGKYESGLRNRLRRKSKRYTEDFKYSVYAPKERIPSKYIKVRFR